MANFAVSVNEDVLKKGNHVLDLLARPGEKKGDALDRALDIVLSQIDDEALVDGGVDAKALEASLDSIRKQFLAQTSAKQQILAKKEATILELKRNAAAQETDFHQRMSNVERERNDAQKACREAEEQMQRADEMTKAANSRADASANLVKEKEQVVQMLETQLSASQAMAQDYDRLQKDKAKADARIQSLAQQIAQVKHDKETQARELRNEMTQRIVNAGKDAEIAKERALATLERKLTASFNVRQSELESKNAVLQEKLRVLQDKLDQSVKVTTSQLIAVKDINYPQNDHD